MAPPRALRYRHRTRPLTPRFARLGHIERLGLPRSWDQRRNRLSYEAEATRRDRDTGSLGRLRQRKVVEWMLAYFALAWMALQMTDALREIWSWPVGLQRGITLALGLGVMPAAVIAWYHGEKGRQKVCFCEVALIAALLAGGAWVIRGLCN